MLHLQSLGVLQLADGRGNSLDPVVRQPKRLALLAYVTTRRPVPQTDREQLLALFWPELDDAHARNALNKTLHFLRRHLPEGILVSHGRTRVGIDPERLTCDAVEFRRCLEAGAPDEALALYAGSFLPGLHVDGAPGFQAWLESERDWYRARARAAGLKLIEADLSRGRTQAALEWAATLSRLSPHDEEVVRATVRAHLRAGDRLGALERLERFEQWLREEMGMGVPADLVRLLNEPTRVHRSVDAGVSSTDEPPPELLAASRAATRVENLDEYREFVDLLPDIAYRCDLRGSFPFVNEPMTRIMGWSREELRHISYDQLVREDFRDRVIEFYVRQVDERIPLTYLEFPAVARDGREIWVGQRVRLLERDDMPVGIEAVTRDITTRIRREKANRRSAIEDRETRLLNRDGFALVARQRIRENQRNREPFFVLHVRIRREDPSGFTPDEASVAAAMRTLGAILRNTVRESDAMGRIGEMEIAIIAPGGGHDEARSMLDRVSATMADATRLEELAGMTVHCEAVVHDAAKLESADALMTFAWVVQE